MNKLNPIINSALSGWRSGLAQSLILKDVRIIDPASSLDQRGDLAIHDGQIKHLLKVPDRFKGEEVSGEGWVVCPGLFDMHVHLREPGFEHKETVRTGCLAAIAGGFTGVAPMPNTHPAADNPGIVNLIRSRAFGLPVDVCPIAATTLGRKGETLSDMAELCEDGVSAFSDDGSPVVSAGLMRLALEYSRMLNAVIIEHCEEPTMTLGGVADEGAVATTLGLPPWPAAAETIAIERNIRLAEYTGGRLHIAHVSTAAGLQLIRDAKKRGVNVTAEVTPHHLTLDSRVLESFDTNYKVNPPLRTPQDVEALIQGLADGSIDVIASDHAPHASDEKAVEFINAPFGMLGLETTLGIILTKLVATGKVSLARVIDALTAAPRRILQLPQAVIAEGQPANLTLFNPQAKWTVDRNRLHSRSQNTPYHGWELTGQACGIINRGLFYWREI
ncbi:MAG: dihydroorotase [Calditrichota bacterium]